jgi:hypothetical protein
VSEKRDKRGKNYARRIHERHRAFARHLLKCYAAAGHQIADRPVLIGKDGAPLHPSLEDAVRWGYAIRDHRQMLRDWDEALAFDEEFDLAFSRGDM